MVTFSNPRLTATIENWPLGGSKRGTAAFVTERHPKRGVRIGRTTTGKTKFTTYCYAACIVDGDNGKTYLLMMSEPTYGSSISIMSSDMQHNAGGDELGFPHYVSKDSEQTELYATLAELIAAAQ